ncbi:MAG: S-layer homology domain-containing protein [Eubacteriales bacterium]|nr:S-layer homology domain-containing protein [Eubacteriales bacterium]
MKAELKKLMSALMCFIMTLAMVPSVSLASSQMPVRSLGGTPDYAVDFTINHTDLNMYIGDTVQLTASPVPEGVKGWKGVQWYVNGSGASLYEDAECEMPYDRYSDGSAVSVYLKADAQGNNITVGAETTFAGSGGIPTTRFITLNVADDSGYFKLERMNIPDIQLEPGEATEAEIEVFPEQAAVGNLEFEKTDGPSCSEIFFAEGSSMYKLAVSAPESAKSGIYRYSVKDTDSGVTASVEITVDSVGIPIECVTIVPSVLFLSPGEGANVKAVVTPENANENDVVWSLKSSSPDISFDIETKTVIVSPYAAVGTEAELVASAGGMSSICLIRVSAPADEEFDPDYDLDFTDVSKDSWFYRSVAYVYFYGLMYGTGDTTFSPYMTVNRGMIVTILYRQSGSPYVESDCPFSDVGEESYYRDAVTWAAENSIVSGYGGGIFGPEDDITREQMAAILYRHARAAGFDVTDTADISTFADYKNVSSYAVSAVSWANATGVMSGTGNNMLNPQGKATRAQAASILHRFCEKFKIIDVD